MPRFIAKKVILLRVLLKASENVPRDSTPCAPRCVSSELILGEVKDRWKGTEVSTSIYKQEREKRLSFFD